ncbi:hypothetical protein ACFOWE_24465 [Planomonospora corallina]|uniref:Uncharacterized protein n=1 Tax=Planomonospora corallina TaxID=1806052 RepID=A0ABV8IEM6_9ACTN
MSDPLEHGGDRPSALAAGELARLEALVHRRLSERACTAVALSPLCLLCLLCPLGTVSAVAAADQNKVVTTVRTAERARPWPSRSASTPTSCTTPATSATRSGRCACPSPT